MHRCQALTTRGSRCRRQALAYYRCAHGELLLCAEHQRQARQGQLRPMADQLRAVGKP